MNEERNKEMAKYYLSGLSLDEVGAKYGISRQRVKQIMERMNLHREPATTIRIKKKIKDIDISELRNNGISIVEIVKQMGTSPETLKKYVDITKYPKYSKGMKPCRICGVIKPFSEFAQNKQNTLSGCVSAYCKECVNKQHSEKAGVISINTQVWKENNREKYRKYHREYKKRKYHEAKAAKLTKEAE